ncbi:hypothetical protein RQM59_11610 [Flavobacteriaceae bacterium S356]|uniref:Uncharacterized protein n=1 Tax=Asprobacillus argus TaxID=3076534 RepID=A0ABU3LH51_9FLAO|nr:hypothetical protein [Flavobacteriaceae bacterium S356]
MKFRKIKKRFLEKRYQSLLKEPEVKKKPVHQKVTTVGILGLETISQNVDLQQLVTNTFDVRNPKIYSFRAFSKDNESSYKHFSENDFDWKGNITDSSLQAFLDTEFDLLITFFDQKHLYAEYVTLLSKATFKVGYAEVDSRLFDMEVKTEGKDMDAYLNEVKKYLVILNRMDG